LSPVTEPVTRRVAFTMFGRFAVVGGGAAEAQLEGRKVQELIGYLLLFRAKPHRREVVADTLWGTTETLLCGHGVHPYDARTDANCRCRDST
jgi:hypothetical protein